MNLDVITGVLVATPSIFVAAAFTSASDMANPVDGCAIEWASEMSYKTKINDMAGSLLGLLLGGNAVSAFPPPRGSPGMGWNAWNTFSVDGKPLRTKLHAVQYLRLQNVGAYYLILFYPARGWKERVRVDRKCHDRKRYGGK